MYYIEFNKSHQILRVVMEGAVSDADIRQTLAATFAIAAERKPSGGIIDLTGVTSLDVASSTIRFLAMQEPPFADAPRCIIAPTDYLFGLARMFQMFGESTRPNLYVVRTANEANQRLGITAELVFERLEA